MFFSVLMSLLMLLFGMGGPVPGPSPIDPPMVHGPNVDVRVGETVNVALGPGNDSIGHNYYIVDGEDNGFATLEQDGTSPDPGCPPGGCNYTHFVRVTGTKPGEFTFTTQYCFRTPLEGCETSGEQPATFTVTVAE